MYRCADLYHVLRRIFHKLGTCKTCCRESGSTFYLRCCHDGGIGRCLLPFHLKAVSAGKLFDRFCGQLHGCGLCLSIFRSKNLNLEGNLAPLLEIESGSNDPFSYMLTVIALTVMKGGELDFIWKMVFLQLAVGAGVGAAVGIAGPKIIRKFKFCTDGFDAVLYWQRL